MYRYDEFDQRIVDERVAQFRGQVGRRLSGALTEDEFKPLRLMNGLYLQLHAYMLRVAIPYGTLNAVQMRKLAHIARTYDKGYGHFTTRQNIQFNWPRLGDVPDILDELAQVEMHAIQTSGNCIRNVTADHFAGATGEEVADPRVISEVIRQWSTFHPEFSFLPRKFKIAVTAASADRAAIRVHDIGLEVTRNHTGELGTQVWVGGGQGRTPMIAHKIADFVPDAELLTYLEAIMRVYNLHGRRDNIYKARIKILVHALGPEEFAAQVAAEFDAIKSDGLVELPAAELTRIENYFASPAFEHSLPGLESLNRHVTINAGFADWITQNTVTHKAPGYAIVTISLKPLGGVAGDATAEQMDAVADLAEQYSFGEIRVSHEQNLVLPHVPIRDLPALYKALDALGLGTGNVGLASDMIVCPGLDYCNLANARSIPIAQEIAKHLAPREKDIGELKIKISGCINACGHHHVGHIGILGVDRKGVEYYQISLGGSADENPSLGDIVGPSFDEDHVIKAFDTIIDTYMAARTDGETFLATYRRIGLAPFKEALYDAH